VVVIVTGSDGEPEKLMVMALGRVLAVERVAEGGGSDGSGEAEEVDADWKEGNTGGGAVWNKLSREQATHRLKVSHLPCLAVHSPGHQLGFSKVFQPLKSVHLRQIAGGDAPLDPAAAPFLNQQEYHEGFL
jgi:hypothetical protein